MNYYPFHMGDYAKATRHLTWDEDAAYRRLLDAYYTSERPLPIELRAVCRLVLAITQEQRAAVETVLKEFFEETEDGWVNRRAKRELQTMREKQQKQRDKANKRWHGAGSECGTATAMPQHVRTDATASDSDADAMPPTPTLTPTPTPRDEISVADATSSAELTQRQLRRKPSRKPQPYTAQALEPSASGIPHCPADDIIAAYHEALPELPAVKLKTADRLRNLSSRWRWVMTSKKANGERRATDKQAGIAWFVRYFAQVRDNDFLMGRTARSGPHANWRCDLDFLLTDKGMKQVIEKTYLEQANEPA